MSEALRQAQAAFERDEVPIGAVITLGEEIIARAHNQVETLRDPTAHAEMIAITQATSHVGGKWLDKCTIYVTIEPCSMCAGALVLARIKKLCFGADDPKAGGCGSVLNVIGERRLNHRVVVSRGILVGECGELMTEFFRRKRALGKG